ncbi:hypothetical protein BGX27_005999 [Mortierella sp. AM989]|nr:hypothetical protein BGX27_005999 [Mortierella sp. AM989]
MHFRCTLTLSILILVLICITFTNAADNICQGCLDDVVHAVPSCDGLDTQKKGAFSSFTSKEQQCMCNIGQNTAVFSKCSPLCPVGINEELQSGFNAVYSVYCNNTAFANGGSTGENSGSGVSMFTSASAAAIAVIAFVLATVAA